MSVNLAIGLCTPPYGCNFVGAAVAKIRLDSMFKYIIPFFIASVAALLSSPMCPGSCIPISCYIIQIRYSENKKAVPHKNAGLLFPYLGLLLIKRLFVSTFIENVNIPFMLQAYDIALKLLHIERQIL